MRKIDFFGQLVLTIFILSCTLSKAFQIVALFGMFFLGVWQVLSAIVLTILAIKNKNSILGLLTYWFLVLLVLLINTFFNIDTNKGLYLILIPSSVCAVYFLVWNGMSIYKINKTQSTQILS